MVSGRSVRYIEAHVWQRGHSETWVLRQYVAGRFRYSRRLHPVIFLRGPSENRNTAWGEQLRRNDKTVARAIPLIGCPRQKRFRSDVSLTFHSHPSICILFVFKILQACSNNRLNGSVGGSFSKIMKILFVSYTVSFKNLEIFFFLVIEYKCIEGVSSHLVQF